MTLKYYTKQVYGNQNIYLSATTADEEIATSSVLRLIGKRTIDESDMSLLGNLGFTFERVFEPEGNN